MGLSKEKNPILVTGGAGFIGSNFVLDWLKQDEGLVIGEGYHFIDLLRFLADSPIRGFQAVSIGKVPGMAVTEDKASITLRFEDSSISAIHYWQTATNPSPRSGWKFSRAVAFSNWITTASSRALAGRDSGQ